ncbi:MAG: GNAT family N-acetyltransferase [Patescibacteria group bacterium]
MAIIKTKKFILRPFKMSDAKGVVKAINNRTIARNTLTIPYPYKLKDAKEWLKKSLPQNKRKIIVNFCVEIDGKVAGSIGLHKIIKEHKAELGYWLAEKYWGKGLMTKIVKQMTEFGFNKLKLKRIFAFTHPFNKASMRVLGNNGFKLEGIIRKNIKKSNKFLDSYLFSKIK